jgi:hypothetical protein
MIVAGLVYAAVSAVFFSVSWLTAPSPRCWPLIGLAACFWPLAIAGVAVLIVVVEPLSRSRKPSRFEGADVPMSSRSG